MKFSSILIALAAAGNASAFSPARPINRVFASKPLFADETDAPTPTAPVPEQTEPVKEPEVSPAGALVPIKEETIEFTAGLIGGAVGFAVGGPVLAAVAAAAANYASKTDKEIGEVVQAVSKASIEVYNYLATLDAKYEVLTKAQGSLEDALEKVKSAEKYVNTVSFQSLLSNLNLNLC